MRSFSDAPAIMKEFLDYQLVVQNKSIRTVTEYYYDLRTFFRYILKKRSPDTEPAEIQSVDLALVQSITASELFGYLSYINLERNNAERARARKISSLKSFFKYLTEKAGLLKENPAQKLELPKLRKTLPVYLSLEESQRLLRAVGGPDKERDLCIITLFLNCGMRVSELTGINLSDMKQDTIRILGKGNKERTVYLTESCKIALNNYLRLRPNDGVKDRDALFISRENRRITTRTVQRIVKRHLEAAGLDAEKYSPHKLRHTAATLMYQYADADIRVLQEILGHENLNTTEIYTHVENKQVRDAAMKHPLG